MDPFHDHQVEDMQSHRYIGSRNHGISTGLYHLSRLTTSKAFEWNNSGELVTVTPNELLVIHSAAHLSDSGRAWKTQHNVYMSTLYRMGERWIIVDTPLSPLLRRLHHCL